MSQWGVYKDMPNCAGAFAADCGPTQAQAHTGQVMSKLYYLQFQHLLPGSWGKGCVKHKVALRKVIILGVMHCRFY